VFYPYTLGTPKSVFETIANGTGLRVTLNGIQEEIYLSSVPAIDKGGQAMIRRQGRDRILLPGGAAAALGEIPDQPMERIQAMNSATAPKAAYFCNRTHLRDYVYGPEQMAAVTQRCEIYPEVISSENFEKHAPMLKDIEYIFSTWSMPGLTVSQIQQLPSLKAVFYAAGSVQQFARPFLANGIKVFSAWAANAIPVAEFALAQILLSCKGYFRNTRECKDPGWMEKGLGHKGVGVYGNTVALIGFGMIGRKLADLLRPFHIEVLVVDPHVSDEVLSAHNARRATLEEAFSTAYVVSNHLPDLPPTAGMLKREHFSAMRENATFINTGRGAQIVEADLIGVLRARPDLTALLDVTFPEPPPPDSPFYQLPNVQLSSHIAGSINNEVHRMADTILEEYDRLATGASLRYEVTESLLETMA